MFATLTSKGQLTLPKEIRDRLNLDAAAILDFQIQAENTITGLHLEAELDAHAVGVGEKDLPGVAVGQAAALEGLANGLEPSLERRQVVGVEGEVIDRAPGTCFCLACARQHVQDRLAADVEPAPGYRDGWAGANAKAQQVAIEALGALEVGAAQRDMTQ
jgi:AbrB family looped-hinge helix DNA binding protein